VIGAMTAAVCLVTVALVVAAFGGFLGFLSVFPLAGLLAGGLVAVLYALDAAAETLAAFVGGVPVLGLFVLLLGVGLGWGGGYYLTATAAPDATANGTAADFDAAPDVRDALFDPERCEGTERRVCRLGLRGSEHDVAAGRFLDSHGVRCPYLHADPRAGGRVNQSVVAEHDGRLYRVTCVPFGD
jgi:hypothetical protein